MNKYASLQADVYSIFSSVTWLAESIKTVPSNFVGTGIGNEYIRVAIVAGGNDPKIAKRSVSGQLLIDIFTPAGGGPLRAAQIADKLDTYLVGKTLQVGPNGNTQLGLSTLSPLGIDKANTQLCRDSYSISFNYFGI
jgi:hypothetical protein